jgi:hypothetical protein
VQDRTRVAERLARGRPVSIPVVGVAALASASAAGSAAAPAALAASQTAGAPL